MATKLISGILREVWQSSAPLDGGGTEIVSTGIACSASKLSQIQPILKLDQVTNAPKITGAASVVDGKLTIILSNAAAAGNTASWILDVTLNHSFQQASGSVTAPVLVIDSVSTVGSADWPIDQVRHFLVDPVNGLDTNVGYVDADIAATSINTVGKPVKTIARYLSIVPRQGNGRMAISHFANSSHDSGTQITELLDYTGLGGYKSFLKRAWTAWLDQSLYPCWSFRDRDISGAKIAIPGPNPDGSWTVNTTITVNILRMTNIVGGAIFADDFATLFRVRFSGNVTAGMRDMRAGIYKSSSGTLELISDPADRDWNILYPAAGDTFWIERPGILLNGGYRELTGLVGEVSATYNHDKPMIANHTVGLAFSSTGSGSIWIGSEATACNYIFCEQSATAANVYRLTSRGDLYFNDSGGYGPGGEEYTWSPSMRFAATTTIVAQKILWDMGFGSAVPPSGVDHGRLVVSAERVYSIFGGVFVGGLSFAVKGGIVGNWELDESFSRIMRVQRVLETGHGTSEFINGGELTIAGVWLDDAVLKLGDSTEVPLGMNALIANITGGPTVNAACGATGKKTAIYCRNTRSAKVFIGFKDGTGIPTATGVDGDILLNNLNDWSKILAYADIVGRSHLDATGTLWLTSTGDINRTGEGYLLQGNQLTDADLTIAPGTDKCSLYVLPRGTLTANHNVRVAIANMLPRQGVCILVRDTSANTYAILDDVSGATLFTRPANPGAVCEVWVQLDVAGTNIELDCVFYKDT
jgi:hypothetical protein